MTRNHAALLLPLLLAATGLGAASPARDGVFVVSVDPDGGGARADLRPGDVLTAWERPAGRVRGGPLRDPLDLEDVEVEQSGRSPVRVSGLREGVASTWWIGDGEWKLAVRPVLPPEAVLRWSEAVDGFASGSPEGVLAGERILRSSAEEAGAAGRLRSALFYEAWLAEQLAGVREGDRAVAAIDRAAALAGSAARKDLRSTVAFRKGVLLERLGDPDGAAEAYRDAICFLGGERSLRTARAASALADARVDVGDLDEALESAREALEIRESLAPGALAEADSRYELGTVSAMRGNLDAAEVLFRRALEIREGVRPGSREVARVFVALGNVAAMAGDLETGEMRLRSALEILERVAPGSDGVATCLNNLSNMARERGDLEAAESLLRRALEIRERLAPGTRPVASTLSNLGLVASARGDRVSAKFLLARALAIFERISPASPDTAKTLGNLGIIAELDDELDRAEELLRRALTIYSGIERDSLDVAWIEHERAVVARRREEFELAETLARHALAVREEKAPRGLDEAYSASTLGHVLADEGKWDESEARFRHALEIRRSRAPGSMILSDGAAALAAILRRTGRPGEALCLLDEALDSIERQDERLGGTDEVKSAFRADFLNRYRAEIDLLVSAGREAEAFAVLERSRARQLLALLAGRELDFGADVPAGLGAEWKRANDALRNVLSELGEIPEEAGPSAEAEVRGRLAEARQRIEELRGEIRSASPRLSSLRSPESLDLATASAYLDAGTLLLSFSIGAPARNPSSLDSASYLFAVGPDPKELRVFRLGGDRDSLAELVRRFRAVVDAGEGSSSATLVRLARELGGILLAPAESQIRRASRILISPDRPLGALPFAALAAPGRSDFRYLVEEKPTTVISSATVFEELRKARRKGRVPKLAIFGDPVPGGAAEAGPEGAAHRSGRRGWRPGPLPASRREAEAISRLLPASTSVFLGSEATEEHVLGTGRDVTILHLGCHGRVDEEHPLDSVLAFSPAGADSDGFLEAWEVFEKLRLDADLVTLSACETALGRETDGEGMLGLTRAFQYAGARTILASLWSVADESTADLMEVFYRSLLSGLPKDESLRSAQLSMIARKGAAASPFHWAAFELNGDWK